MARFALIRSAEAGEQTIPETTLPTEAQLHEALIRHPELLPAEDLGLGRVAVIGVESGLASGYADLVLLDDSGQLCLVEVKKEGNPDTRRVVAQLLDYAAALWGQSLDEFQRAVYDPYAGTSGSPAGSLSEFIATQFGTGGGLTDEGELAAADLAAVEERLERSLETGRFVMVVAAPQVPLGVRRALEYLNAQGLRLYALEVSYFQGPVECFVPRLVVQPRADEKPVEVAPYDREAFLARLAPDVQPVIASFLDECVEKGGRVSWKAHGPSIEVRRLTKSRQIASITPRQLSVVRMASGGFPHEPYVDVAEALERLGVGVVTPTGWYHNVPLDADPAVVEAACRAVVDLCRSLARPEEFVELENPLLVTFSRNDFNIWEAHVGDLAKFHGRALRANLRRTSGGQAAGVELQPLANAARGWVPRFDDANAQAAVWPNGGAGEYTLTVTAATEPRS
jgi:hypothetical protein